MPRRRTSARSAGDLFARAKLIWSSRPCRHERHSANVGGFAGLSFQIQNFKISAGYRADLFFGAGDQAGQGFRRNLGQADHAFRRFDHGPERHARSARPDTEFGLPLQ